MFDGLLGKKFSVKCKQSIKSTKARVFERRKKKQAVLNFLKKDIADLLAIDEEHNAFGRMDGLIVEANKVACYDTIEQLCEHILSILPALQKKKECPEEAMEAVATLIYAASRFSDLPELCDLRLNFTTRYGSALESSLNQEFVDMVSKKPFPRERKLKMMQEIANEFSIKWDSKNFGQKKAMTVIPPVPVPNQPKMDVQEIKQKQGDISVPPPSTAQNAKASDMVDSRPPSSTPRTDIKRQAMRSVPNEVHMIPDAKRGLMDRVPEQEKKPVSTARTPLGLKPLIIEKDRSPYDHINAGRQPAGMQSTNVKPIVAPSRDVKLNEHRFVADKGKEDHPMPTIEKPVVRTPRPENVKVNVVPPYVIDKGLKNTSPTEEKQPIAPGKPPVVEHNVTPPVNRIPPYVKPGKIENRTRREETENVENLNLPTQATAREAEKPRSVRKNKHVSSSSSQQKGEDAVAINADERIDQIVFGRRRGTRSFDAGYDEEELVMDKLLMHYSLKGTTGMHTEKPRKARRDCTMYRDIEITEGKMERDERAFARVVSLPPERTNPTIGRIHPRLPPDYEELAARFNALKKN